MVGILMRYVLCIYHAAFLIGGSLFFSLPAMAMENSWYQQGDDWLNTKLESLQQAPSEQVNKAKNLILFVGDGMSITTLTAGRIWQGQQMGKLGEEHFLHFEHFPHSALIKTYNTNQQTPDSAGTMSAIMTGVKTRAGLISMGPEQDKSECENSSQYHQQTLLEWGHQAGYGTGVVTTARLTHATPAATYAHSPDRGWEGDWLRHPNAYWHGCDSIAKQLIETAFPKGLDLAFGGGLNKLDNHLDTFSEMYGKERLITNLKDFHQVNSNLLKDTQSPVLGVFSPSHMAFEVDRVKIKKQKKQQPSLKEMTEKALALLQTKGQGYLLIVEGARIDQAHHKGNAARALAETAMLAETVKRADEMTSDEDTLIIVTADHSHSFTMAGYPKRGNPILATSRNQQGELVLAKDGLPYTTLGYANGETHGRQFSHFKGAEHEHFEQPDSEDVNFKQGVAVPLSSETHGSDDVALHAKGPGAELFSGLMEQHEIFHTLMQVLETHHSSSRFDQQGGEK
jgi:alkaline phosphatase